MSSKQTIELLEPLHIDIHCLIDVLVSDSGMGEIKHKRKEDSLSSKSPPPIKHLIQEEHKVTGSSSVLIFVLPNM